MDEKAEFAEVITRHRIPPHMQKRLIVFCAIDRWPCIRARTPGPHLPPGKAGGQRAGRIRTSRAQEKIRKRTRTIPRHVPGGDIII
jgi:hypothetical protein